MAVLEVDVREVSVVEAVPAARHYCENFDMTQVTTLAEWLERLVDDVVAVVVELLHTYAVMFHSILRTGVAERLDA